MTDEENSSRRGNESFLSLPRRSFLPGREILPDIELTDSVRSVSVPIHAPEALLNHVVHDLLHRLDIMEDAADLTDGQDSVVQISGLERGLQPPSGDKGGYLFKGRAALLQLFYLQRKAVCKYSGGVGKAAEYQCRSSLIQPVGDHPLSIGDGGRFL